MDSNKTQEFMYIMKNEDWNNKYKYGYTTNLKNRLRDHNGYHSKLTNYIYICELKKNSSYKLYKEFDKLFSVGLDRKNLIGDINELYKFSHNEQHTELIKIKEYLVNDGGGEEFIYKEGLDFLKRFIENGFEKFGLLVLEVFVAEKINCINETRNKEYQLSLDKELKKYDSIFTEVPEIPKKVEKTPWDKREYQTEIIEESIERLKRDNKIYIELATGGGKSYIVFKILKHFKPKTIIIFSPRKKINQQNSSEKYLSILNNEYLVYNCSEGVSFPDFEDKCKKENKKMIIVACPQGSNEKVYNLIRDNNLNDIFVWFDEAHNTIENWVNKFDNKYIKFFLENKDILKF